MIKPNDTLGTKKIMLLGSGELGREVIIEAQRLGVKTVAVDRYEGAPGQQCAHKAYTIDMKDAKALREVIEKEKPDAIVPEIEAINLDLLMELESEGYFIVPQASATYAAMHRKRIREVIATKAGVPTSKYLYANTEDIAEVTDAIEKIGYPCHTKPIMSSSGHGSYFVKSKEDIPAAIEAAKKGARGSSEELIIEEHIPFSTEITELAVRYYNEDGKVETALPYPVGHVQIDGDYHSSWQSPNLSDYLPYSPEDSKGDLEELALDAKKQIFDMTQKITDALGGLGLFGCEQFISVVDGKVKVYANEISPRPHDTGMVTILTHQMGMSECGLHARAILGFPISTVSEEGFNVIKPIAPGSSHVILSPHEGKNVEFRGMKKGFAMSGVSYLFFGKPEAHVNRRMGVVLATGKSALDAKKKAEECAHFVEIKTDKGDWAGQQEKKKHLL